MLKIAAMVTLFYPNSSHYENIMAYLDEVDKLYVIDNTPKSTSKE